MRSDLEFLVYTNSSKKIRRRKKTKLTYEPLKLIYTIERTYTPDFIITRPGHHDIYVEVKGYFRSSDRTKMRRVKECNPSLDIRLIFPYDNKITSKSRMRYSDWCNKYGFKYHIGTEIPDGWLGLGGSPRRRGGTGTSKEGTASRSKNTKKS